MKDEIEWWGYIHINGSPQAKVYFGEEDIDEANKSPFCKMVVGPFKARGREHALEKIIELNKDKLN